MGVEHSVGFHPDRFVPRNEPSEGEVRAQYQTGHCQKVCGIEYAKEAAERIARVASAEISDNGNEKVGCTGYYD